MENCLHYHYLGAKKKKKKSREKITVSKLIRNKYN